MLSGLVFSRLLVFLCACLFIICTTMQGAATQSSETICKEISDDFQIGECFNRTRSPNTSRNTTSPVTIQSTIDGKFDFICPNQRPLYAFSCLLHGYELIWNLNGSTLTSFQSGDEVGRERNMSYPRSNPVYNISATLTHVTKVNGSRYLPFCISTLIVQPYNESKLELVPFNVSCQTYCEDENRTGICKTKSYKVATDQPSEPIQVSGRIQNISAGDIGAVVSVNWAPPVNQNETDIDYYEVTLIGSHTSNTTMIERLPSTQTATFSYNFGVSDTNYSAVNITAVDLCGQRSEPSQTMLNLTSPTGCPSNQIASISQRPEMIVSSILLAITTILLVS